MRPLLSAGCLLKWNFPADVAQLVEQSIRNRQVSGSIPLVGSIVFVASLHTALRFSILEELSCLTAAGSARVRPRPCRTLFVATLQTASRFFSPQETVQPYSSGPGACSASPLSHTFCRYAPPYFGNILNAISMRDDHSSTLRNLTVAKLKPTAIVLPFLVPERSYSLIRIFIARVFVFVSLAGMQASAQTLVSAEKNPDLPTNPIAQKLIAAAKVYFRDTAEFPMKQVTTMNITDSAGKIRRPTTAVGDYLFRGYSKKNGSANATFHSNISMWAAFRGAKSARLITNGMFFTMLPGLQIYAGTDGYNIEDDPAAQQIPRVRLSPTKPCPTFSATKNPGMYLPDEACGESEFYLDVDSKLQKFTFESAGLPVQLKLDPLGNCTLLRYHAEVTFQSVTLPDEKAPFLVPALATSTLTTNKGTIVVTSKYEPKR